MGKYNIAFISNIRSQDSAQGSGMGPKRKIDILTLMALLEKVRAESRKQRLTTTRILRLTRVGSLHTLYAYVRFACDRGLMHVVTVHQGRRLYGAARYYYLTRAGENLLAAWKRLPA
jgi:hypothetical protein